MLALDPKENRFNRSINLNVLKGNAHIVLSLCCVYLGRDSLYEAEALKISLLELFGLDRWIV